MKISKIIKSAMLWLVLGLGLSIVQPVRGQVTNPVALFQYAIFYNGLLEFSDCATLTINGPVQCNSNIYLGTPSGSTLTFNNLVTTSGTITDPTNVGMSPLNWTGTTSYKGTPAPGWVTNAPTLAIPMGSPSNSPAAIIQLPTGTELTNPSATNVLSLQRYYYKADLVILVTNTTATNVAVSVTFKNSMFDLAPLTVSYTNYSFAASTNSATSNGIYAMNTNWAQWFGSTNSLSSTNGWLTTNATFYDARQNQTNHVTQIDVGKFGTWIATNTNCVAKWNAANPFNGIIYVADMRTTNGMYMDCVRLTNGQVIPTIGASNTSPYTISGLTVATINPLYIAGYFNCPGTTNIGTANTGGTSHCSVVCDALTILSPSWKDGNSWFEIFGSVPTATSDTVNTAIIAGNVPSTGSGVTQYSGGLQNLLRLLESWSGDTLTLNTSLVNLYPSAQATAQFQEPSAYYSAPTRGFSFDQNFTNLSSLPPGTPLFTQTVPAIIELTNLVQAYNGSNLAPNVATIPPGLNVRLEYEGNNSMGAYFSNAVDAGTYIVVATVNDPLYSGVVSNFFYIDPAPVTILMTNLTKTYSGTYQLPSISTIPSGIFITASYNGTDDWPINAGSYTVVATINDEDQDNYYDYYGSATNTLIINPAAAALTFSNLAQVFTGAPESASVTTVPPGLALTVTYNGSTNAPTNAGSYVVVGTVNDSNYQGSATNTLVIVAPAPGPIMVSGSTTLADGTFQLSFTNTPGASFTVLGSPDPTAPLTNWTVVGSVIEVSPGQFQFIDGNATNLAQEFYVVRSP